MGTAVGKRADQPGAGGTPPLVVCLGQQEDELTCAAAGGGIAPLQTCPKDLLQMVHSPVQAVAGQRGILRRRGGEQGHVDRPAAPGRRPGGAVPSAR